MDCLTPVGCMCVCVCVRACVRACVCVCVSGVCNYNVNEKCYNWLSRFFNSDKVMFVYSLPHIVIVMRLQQGSSLCQYYYVNYEE